MWPWLCLTLAYAQPDLPFPRADEALIERRFARVVGDGPAWGHTWRAGGPVRAWIFPDGVIEHAVIITGRDTREERRYDAAGHLITTTRWQGDDPVEVVVRDATPIDPSGWEVQPVPGAVLRVPPVSDDLFIAWAVVPGEGDPLSDGFRAGLAERCACRLEDRTTTWIEGRPGARYRVRVLDPDAPWTGEIWAVRGRAGTLLLTALVPSNAAGAPSDGMAALATGRAVAALVRWEETP